MSTLNTFVEIEVEVAYSYYKGCKGAREPGGMQIEPDEPENVEITGVTVGGVDIESALTKEQLESLEEQCLEDVHDRMEAAREAVAESRYEDRRTR